LVDVTGLKGDNTCAGCHSPTNGFGDGQPIAIGIDNNRIVRPGSGWPAQHAACAHGVEHRLFPALMWNGASALSANPF
jgi:cytochrome c peroxidase